jgi:trehalose 2-sulfotransferase
MKPQLSYTIWFSQRTGSTLLCKALESTGIAGRPGEWLNTGDPKLLPGYYGATNITEMQETVWKLGSTANGIFGLKFGLHEPHFSALLAEFRKLPDAPRVSEPRAAVWDHAFPNSRHIFLTRRNKVRLAVSWWKAIRTEEWHRETGQPTAAVELADAYSFDAINHLYTECSMREAGIQEFFSEACIVPLTVVYEDFIQTYTETVHRVLDYLGLENGGVSVEPPHYAQLADDISESWVQRFREERQQGWDHRGW